ncbi:MAG TPA: GNAT family N-acetyltransferase [Longimicrobium sp.]
MLSGVAARLRGKGFTGPRYVGLAGKLRFLAESTLWRRELVFAATPAGFAAAPRPQGPPLELHRVRTFAEMERFRGGIDAAWYPGLTDTFHAPFGWGEEAVVGTIDGDVACYCWMQFGTAEGFPTYYGRMLEREARILRAGVAPAFRRAGLNKRTMHHLLERSFAEGVERVWAECYLNNLPAARTFLRIGFRAVGVLTVVEMPPLRGFVRWRPLEPAAALFRRHGVELLAAAPSAPSPQATEIAAGVA